jgi:hypothetical protein
MKHIQMNFSKLLMAILVAGIALGGATSCKSKKKLAAEQAAAEEAKKIEQAVKDLNAIIDGTTTWTLDEQASRVATIKSWNLDNAEVAGLISQAEKVIDERRAEAQRKAEEERLRKEEEARIRAEQAQYSAIDNQFKTIAAASGVDDANSQINVALQQFASPDVPVLIIISQVDGIPDYDRPTTALNFMNYLKDVKNYVYKVVTVKRNDAGKITELELLKN